MERKIKGKKLAILFHETYEKLAPKFNWITREASRNFDETSANGKLMIAVCNKIFDQVAIIKRDIKTACADYHPQMQGKQNFCETCGADIRFE